MQYNSFFLECICNVKITYTFCVLLCYSGLLKRAWIIFISLQSCELKDAEKNAKLPQPLQLVFKEKWKYRGYEDLGLEIKPKLHL